jgi:hypothetical protein
MRRDDPALLQAELQPHLGAVRAVVARVEEFLPARSG